VALQTFYVAASTVGTNGLVSLLHHVFALHDLLGLEGCFGPVKPAVTFEALVTFVFGCFVAAVMVEFTVFGSDNVSENRLVTEGAGSLLSRNFLIKKTITQFRAPP
jgi:hypothetical protein